MRSLIVHVEEVISVSTVTLWFTTEYTASTEKNINAISCAPCALGGLNIMDQIALPSL